MTSLGDGDLRARIERLELALRGSSDGLWDRDLLTDEEYFSERWCEIFGYRKDEVAPSYAAFQKLIHPDDRERVLQAVRLHLDRAEPYDLEYRAVTRRGEVRWVHSRGQAIHDAQGHPVRMAGCVTDITDRKRAEAELQRMSRLYSALSGVNEAIVRLGSREELFREVCRVLVERGGFRMAWIGLRNPESQRVEAVASHGDVTRYLDGIRIYADERPEGRGPTGTAIRDGTRYVCNDFLADPRTVPWREAAARASWRASAVFPFRLDGEVVGALTVYAQEPGFFGEREVGLLEEAASDLSFALGNIRHEERRKTAEAEIRRMNTALEQRVAERTAQLEASNRELEAFSFSVSHDLRAPLRAIEGFSALLERDQGERLDVEGRRHLGLVRTNALRMSRLIDDLLAFSRSARTELRSVRVDMTVLARSAFEEAVPDPGARARIRLVLPDLPAAHGDPALLRQVWLNLLSNAVKYSAKVDAPSIEVGSSPEPGATVYWVRDNGAGFDMTYAGKLFGVFQRLHGPGEFEGTGIGLALVQRIVSRHGGRVHGEGAIGQGATFSFSVPDPPPGA